MKTFKQSSEEEKVIWNAFRQGDDAAFEKMMQAHYRSLFNYGTKFTKDTELVKDSIQDLFLHLWKNRQTLGETAFVKYYLLKAFRRKLCRDLYKNRRYLQGQALDDDYSFDIVFSAETLLVAEQHQKETAEKLARLLSQLPRRQKEVIYLRFYQELNIDQIVQVMDITHQSVYNLLHKALQQIKEHWLNKTTLVWLLLNIFSTIH